MTTRVNSLFLYGAAAVVAAFLLLPMLVVVAMSFTNGVLLEFPPNGIGLRWYAQVLGDPAWLGAALNSLKVAIGTTVLATVLGIGAGLGLVRSAGRGAAALRALIISPLIVPVIIVGVGSFLTFSMWHLVGSPTGLVLAHTVLALPLVVVAVSTSIGTIDPELELAAAGLGANRWRTFLRVTLPLIVPGVVAGALFAFITSWDEIVVAIFMTSPAFRTLPVLIWSQVRTQLDPSVAATGTILLLISTIPLLGFAVLRRESRS